MSPTDVPGPIVTTETLMPWLLAIAPAVEPVRALAQRRLPEQANQPLRPAA
jgi:hypothetical protein